LTASGFTFAVVRRDRSCDARLGR